MIRVRNLRKTFATKEGVVAAVDGIDFDVPDGAFFTLLGPSGCGKSTTLRMLAGLERPDSGEITIGDRLVSSSEERCFVPTNGRAIGMVFQSYAIWPHMSVFRNVAYPLKVKGVARPEIRRRVEEALELVGLEGLGPRSATRLSGGQQQRVALARALVAEPAVLLLDEPLSNLDAKLRAGLRVELKRLQSRIGVTTIYVTHDQQEALAMSDDIAVMSDGRIAQRGIPAEIYHRPRNRFTAQFIGSTNLIRGKVPGGGFKQGLNRLETPLGPLVAHATEASTSGVSQVDVSIRPEVISMSTDEGAFGHERDNVLRGRVEQLVFLGESVDCDIRVGEELLRVKGVSVQQVPVGGHVALHIPPEHCTVLVDEAGADAVDATQPDADASAHADSVTA